MKQNKKILTENKIQQLMNLKNFAQAQTFKKVLSNIFNVSLDNGDIHYIFERLNIPFSIMNVRGMSVKYYKRDAVIEVFYKGLLRKEVENLVRNRASTNAQSTIQGPGYRKSVVVNTTNRYIPNNNNSMEDEYEYPNGENDMEKYSEYLINNVYEEKKNMNKVIINENDLKTLVFESVKKILKESYYNSGIFSDNPDLEKLEKIVGQIENRYLNYDSDTDNISDWDGFIEGVINLYNKSKELVWFKKYNIKDLYARYNHNEDMLFDDFLKEKGIPYQWEWLDEYLDSPDLWEQIIPGPEELYTMIKVFISWVNLYFDVKEQTIVKELNQEKKYIITTLNQNIY